MGSSEDEKSPTKFLVHSREPTEVFGETKQSSTALFARTTS